VFILKEVKVLCFDTVLQVFILKVFICTKIVQLCRSSERDLPLRQRDRGWGDAVCICKEATPPRVFCKKRLDFIDCEGVRFFGDSKEAATAWNCVTYIA
jgi:hypothetical protein